MQTRRIIKKYPNRRLYDTTLCAYITLEDIKKLVFDHVDFQVIDARTKKDLTQSTLLQIITEQEATNTPIFTTPLLQDIIRFYHEKSQTLLSEYLQQSMNVFLQQKDFFKKQWQFLSNPTLFLQQAFMQQAKSLKKSPKKSSKKRKV